MPALNGELRILDRSKLSALYPVLENKLQVPKADDAHCSRQTLRAGREGPTRPVEENPGRHYLYTGLNRPTHQILRGESRFKLIQQLQLLQHSRKLRLRVRRFPAHPR